MSTLPLTSVIVPCYNGGRYVATAVQSVFRQSYPRIEVVVVDDGSTDDSPAILAGFGEAIRYVRQTNQGLSAARNRGIKEARGELLAFLDADDVWLPSKLATQVQ